MLNFIKRNFLYFLLIIGLIYFISPFLLKGLLPIPSDTIVGLYHPFRDFYANNFPFGMPFKNYLITDPVRQIYPWKELVIESWSNFSIPLWNPYEMAGKPLLANFQSGSFYPLNIIFLIKPFSLAWSIFIFLQIILGGTFFYLYLKNLNIKKEAIVMGIISWTFSGFFVSWFEWGIIGHTILWLPLILLSIDKIFILSTDKISKIKDQRLKIFFDWKIFIWMVIFLFALSSSFFAGHLQIFFYTFIFSSTYIIAKLFLSKEKKVILPLLSVLSIFILITSVQWIPTLQFLNQSARSIDQQELLREGWYLPWENLAQFFVPDYFGNPSTLNYWGVWNYGEFVGYIGVLPILFAIFAIITLRRRKILFFTLTFFTSLLFSLPNPISKIPYILGIPFISTAQPTRLISIAVFSLVMLGVLGFDYFLRNENKEFKKIKINSIFVFIATSLIFIILALFARFGNEIFNIPQESLFVTRRNIMLPAIFIISYLIIFIFVIIFNNKKVRYVLLLVALVILSFDMIRFSNKFNAYTKKEYLYPATSAIKFVKKDESIFRIASDDSRILPPNFSTHYKIQSIEGYDPLYLLSYAEFAAAFERGESNIKEPFGFNRIITPHKIDSKFIDLLNVKYVFSFSELKNPKFKKVFQEGITKIYKNQEMYERAFFVKKILQRKGKQKVINAMFENNLKDTAIVEDFDKKVDNLSIGNVEIVEYNSNSIVIHTSNKGKGFLVLSDAYYPTWKVLIDDKIDKIYKTDHSFRGVFVPEGEHKITFYMTLF